MVVLYECIGTLVYLTNVDGRYRVGDSLLVRRNRCINTNIGWGLIRVSFFIKMLNKLDVLAIIIVFCFTCVQSNDFSETDAIAYLNKYENVVNATDDFSDLLLNFQEKYNLPVDGLLNNATIKFMRRPRCQHSDTEFTASTPWKKHHLRWYFPQAIPQAQKDAELAFQMWQNASTLTFEMVKNPGRTPPDITITMVGETHYYRSDCMGNYKCGKKFDGVGGILGHSYYPQSNGMCIEIHLDVEERWYFGNTTIPDDSTSFLMVLTHEIGHALGIGHSATQDAIMYGLYQDKIQSLHADDINAIEYLYGLKNKYVPISTPTTKRIKSSTRPTTPKTIRTSRSTRPTTTTPTIPPIRRTPIKNLCDIVPDFMFLAIAPEFSNYRLYIAHDSLIWKLDLNEMIIPSQPELLNDYIPKELRQYTLQHIFQTTDGDLVTVVSPNKYVSVSFPAIRFIDNFSISIPNNAHINAIFQSNAGRAYVFYNNMSYIEFSNDFTSVSNRGRIRDIFPGIPEDISLAFRWIDGHIYFFRQNSYYKFNEFTRRVVAAGAFDWNLFGVPCPNESMVEQLKTLLYKLLSVYNM